MWHFEIPGYRLTRSATGSKVHDDCIIQALHRHRIDWHSLIPLTLPSSADEIPHHAARIVHACVSLEVVSVDIHANGSLDNSEYMRCVDLARCS